jgi:hypothetical protein
MEVPNPLTGIPVEAAIVPLIVAGSVLVALFVMDIIRKKKKK